AYAEDYGSGGGVLLLTGVGIVSGTAAVSALSELANQGRELAVPMQNNPLDAITRRPAGVAALKVADGLDWNLWPDEEFFIKRRQAHAAVGMKTEKGWFSRTEFPPPSPHYGSVSPLMPIMVAAIALPALFAARAQAAARVAENFQAQAQLQREV